MKFYRFFCVIGIQEGSFEEKDQKKRTESAWLAKRRIATTCLFQKKRILLIPNNPFPLLIFLIWLSLLVSRVAGHPSGSLETPNLKYFSITHAEQSKRKFLKFIFGRLVVGKVSFVVSKVSLENVILCVVLVYCRRTQDDVFSRKKIFFDPWIAFQLLRILIYGAKRFSKFTFWAPCCR